MDPYQFEIHMAWQRRIVANLYAVTGLELGIVVMLGIIAWNI